MLAPRITERPLPMWDDPEGTELRPRNVAGWLLLIASLCFCYISPIVGLVLVLNGEITSGLLAFAVFACVGIPSWLIVERVIEPE